MSYRFEIAPTKGFVARFLRKARSEIKRAVNEEHAARGLTLAQIARELGVNRSVITRQINGESNLTLRTIAEIASILDRDIQFALVPVHTNERGANEMPQPSGQVVQRVRTGTNSETTLEPVRPTFDVRVA